MHESQKHSESRNDVSADLDERALMVIPVRERQKVERLHQDCSDAPRGNVRDQRPRIGANIGIGRTKLCQIRIAERVAVCEFLDCTATVDMQKHDPRVCIQVAPIGEADKLGDKIAVPDQPTDDRLKLQIPETLRRRLKEDRPRFLEVDDSPRVVREHVTRVVIRRRERNATCSTAVLNVFGNRLESFIEQVGGEREK